MKQMQHHPLPPRPPQMRHPIHQGPMHPGHPPPPPHMAINMGPPQQQQPHHIPTVPPPRGPPPPQPYNMPQMRDQNRLGHHQHSQQHTQQRVNNPMQQNHMQQQQHQKRGRPFINGHGNGGGPQGAMKHGGPQKSRPPSTMRNNSQSKKHPQAHQNQQQQQRQPLKPMQSQHQPRGPPPQPLQSIGGVGPQMQLINGPPPPPLQQQFPPHQPQVPLQNAHLPRPSPPSHTQHPHPQKLQQNHKQHQNDRQRTPPRHHHPPHQQQQNRQHQRFQNPRAIPQNSNRPHNNTYNRSAPVSAPVLPTVPDEESTIVANERPPVIVQASSDKLSAMAQDFTPQSAQKEKTEDTNETEHENGDHFNILMKSDGCFSSSKEKTPMCMVNELARFNKIQHQYRLTDESGPAHCKRFTVTLKLGEEEYTAEGYKIKKAQHLAAAEALEHTKYKHPLPKLIRRSDEKVRPTLTPTVELNALAMKLGQQTYYVLDQESNPPLPLTGQPPNHFHYPRLPRNGVIPHQQQQFMAGRGFVSKFHGLGRGILINGMSGFPPHLANAPPPPEICRITLIVGKQQFKGTGRSLQLAKHDAASRALLVLRNQAAKQFKELEQTAEDGEWKSPISLVHEIAIKRDLMVKFKVLREGGPAHMKSYITACMVGDMITQGDGNGKKQSKKRAAEKMLEELKKLPPLTPSKSPPTKRIKAKNHKKNTSPSTKRKGGASIREKTESECAEDANPISRLIQLQQSRNEKEPIYELISKTGDLKKQEFIMEVSIPGKVSRGFGSSKRLAKRNAAQNLLVELGLDVGNSNQENNSKIANQNKVTKDKRGGGFIENSSASAVANTSPPPSGNGNANGGPSGRQIVPGVLLLHQSSKESDEAESSEIVDISTPGVTPTTSISSIATTVQSDTPAPAKEGGTVVRSKDQLFYLAQILGFQANFSDYPKGNHSEFLTIVTLSTSPPQICHGIGMNIDESQDQAASAALQILSKLGLDNIKPKPDD